MSEEGVGVQAGASVRKIPADEENADGPSRSAWAKLGIILLFAIYGLVDLLLEVLALL